MRNEAVIAIVMTEAKGAAERAGMTKDNTAEEILSVTMRASQNHWMATDPEDQIKGAVAAALSIAEGEENERISDALKAQSMLSAMINSGGLVQPNLAEMERIAQRENPVKLQALWEEAKAS